MPGRSRDNDVDRLYQAPLAEFTHERNALAKHVGGEEATRIKRLSKPSASAWAVNQLYWRDRPTYDALIKAAEHLRGAHRAVLGGGNADLRRADATHREAVNAALSSTLRIAKEAGQGVSSAMQMEIARTLQSLPAEAAPGRLTKPLHPGGFEALQGMPLQARKSEPARAREKPSREDKRAAERARAEARRALNDARQNEQRARTAVAHLQKDLAHAEERTAAAKAAWDQAQREEDSVRNNLQDAERAMERATKALRDLD